MISLLEFARALEQRVRLVLIRHGEADVESGPVIAGRIGGRGLTDRGGAQVRALGDRLLATGEVADCQAFLCSSLLRAHQTADILSDMLHLQPAREDCDLCELHPGDADGLTWDEYTARYGAFNMLQEPERPFAPGGESWSLFIHRTRTTLDRLAAQFENQTVLAITHAGFVVASVLTLFDIPRPGTHARLEPGFTSVTEWQLSAGRWTLVRYNDMSHLSRS